MNPTMQIEQINDQAKQDTVEVIVQLEGQTVRKNPLRKAVSEMLLRRRSSLTPRDVIKAPARSPRRIRTRSSRSQSVIISAIKKAASSEMGQMFASAVVKQALSRMEDSYKQTSGTGRYKPHSFWTSQSILLRMTKKELSSLPETVKNIRDIRPNRKLAVPIIKNNKPLLVESEDRLSTTWGLERTNAFGAWGVYGAEGQGVTVGVLDTGIDPEHPDLKDKIAHWAEFDSMGSIIDTDNPRDSDQHGTHVAGTIVGGNESGRWIGMAPLAQIAAGLVLDGDKGGTDAQVLAGMDWAVEKGVDVINMSLGGLVMDAETPPTYSEAIISALLSGIPVVCAIGNEGEQTSGLPGSDLFALSVGATDTQDRSGGFSGGRTQIIYESDFLNKELLPFPYIKPDLSAPGVGIYSSVPGKKWQAFSGTSMATPHVSGAIALLLSATSIRDSLQNEERTFKIHELITGSVDDLGENGQDSRFGFGRLDVLRAIDFATRNGFGI